MSQPVTDPALIEQLNATLGGGDGAPVTDPALLRMLNASLGGGSGGDAEAQAGGFYGTMPITNQGRRQVQRRAMAGLDPTPEQHAALEADRPNVEERTKRFVNTFAPVAAIPLMPAGAAAGLGGRLLQGATLGPAMGYASGFLGGGKFDGSMSEELASRHESGKTGALVGLGLGVGLPLATSGAGWVAGKVSDAVSPTVARYGTEINNLLRRPQPMSGGAAADGGRAPAISGAEAAADQIIANQLMRANVALPEVQRRFADAARSAEYGNSRAQNVLGMVDIDPSLQRLAGSVTRQQPEAANIGGAFLSARQTGVTPNNVLPEAMASRGLPTRAKNAQPMTGADAESAFGSRFGTQADEIVPMGQYERVRDAFKRALRIKDSDFHGHAANARRTDAQVAAAMKDEARANYGAAYAAAAGYDLNPHVAPVIGKWRTSLIDEPVPVARQLKRAMDWTERAMAPGGTRSQLERVNKVKEWLDDEVDKAFRNGDHSMGRALKGYRDDVKAALDGITHKGIGAAYQSARRAYESKAEVSEILEMGRKAMREESDIGLDAYKAIAAPEKQKIFRLGMLDEYEKSASRRTRQSDVTGMFETPRVQELLAGVVPRTQTATGKAKVVNGQVAAFADRPERFGRYIDNERAMVSTRNAVFGNSKTAERLADDASFNTLSGMVEQFRNTPSITAIGLKAVERGLDKLFGFRADTAAFVAHKLFTANPAERQALLRQLESRMGPSRMEQFTRLMAEHQARITQAGTVAMEGGTR